MSPWHRWQLPRAIAALNPLIMIGSGNHPVVKAAPWFSPLTPLTAYLPKMFFGVWQPLQAAAARWLERFHESNWARMTWQFVQVVASSPK